MLRMKQRLKILELPIFLAVLLLKVVLCSAYALLYKQLDKTTLNRLYLTLFPSTGLPMFSLSNM